MLPADLAIPIAYYLDPRERLILATLFRFDRVQASSFVALHHRHGALDVASFRNDMQLLRLLAVHFKESDKVRQHYTEAAIDRASEEGHLEVLDWWKDSGLPLKYKEAMDLASAHGHVAVLQWWKDSGLRLKYRAAMDVASARGHVEVLQWWKDSGLKVKYTDRAVNSASASGQIGVLQWWKDSRYIMKYTERALDDALRSRSAEVLEWWARSGLDLLITERRFLHLTDPWSDEYRWWAENRAQINRARGVENRTKRWAVGTGRPDVLKVWLDIGVLSGRAYWAKRFPLVALDEPAE